MSKIVDEARQAQLGPAADELHLSDPPGARTVNPTQGRRLEPAPTVESEPASRKAVRRTITAGSVGWDEDLIRKLRRLTSDEKHLTRRSIHNILLARFLAMSKAEQRAVIEEALDWEAEMRR